MTLSDTRRDDRRSGRSVALNAVPLRIVVAVLGATLFSFAALEGSEDAISRARTSNVLQLVAVLGTAIFAGWSARRVSSSGRQAANTLAVAALLWSVGQAIWLLAQWNGSEPPFPSVADLCFLASYVVLVRWILLLSQPNVRRDLVRPIFDWLTVGVSTVFMSWGLVTHKLFSSDLDLSGAIGLAYPLADIALVIVALVTLSRRVGPRSSGAVLVAVGAALIAVADGAFVYLDAAGAYSTGALSDLGWVVGWLLFGLSIVLGEATDGSATFDAERPDGALEQWVPLVAVSAAGLTATLLYVGGRSSDDEPALFWLGVLLLATIVTRSIVSQRAGFSTLRQLSSTVEELDSRSTRYEAALVSSGAGTWDWTRATGRIRWSPSLEVLHGREVGTFGGTIVDLLAAIHPDDHDHTLGAFFGSLSGDRAICVLYRAVWPDGTERWIESQGQVTRLDGEVSGLVGLSIDVTSRRDHDRQMSDRARHGGALTELGQYALAAPKMDDFLAQVSAITAAALEVDAVRVLRASPALARRPRPADLAVTVPTVDGDWGALEVHHHDQSREFSDDEIKFLGMAAHLTGSVIDRFRAGVKLEHQALHDRLTGLPNRAQLIDWLETAPANDNGGALIVLDIGIERIPLIARSIGTRAADDAVLEVSRRLRTFVTGVSDVLARTADNAFVVAVRVQNSEFSGALADQIVQAIAEPLVVGDPAEEIFLTACVGMALAAPTSSADDVLGLAAAGRHRAMALGTSCEVADTALMDGARQRLRQEGSLRCAIDHGQLLGHYQPIFRVVDTSVAGVETLVRWEHPTDGLLPAAAFIDAAEDAGLLPTLDTLMLQQAVANAVRWSRLRPGFSVAVNVCPAQIATRGLVDVVSDLLNRHTLDPSSLCIEILESALIDAPTSIAVIDRLRELQVRVAIDDFGAGYSNLNRLHDFSPDVIKVDKSMTDGLVQRASDRAIVASVVALAHEIGAKVVVEGVETEDQLSILRDLGADYVQGWLLGKAMPAEAIDALILADCHVS